MNKSEARQWAEKLAPYAKASEEGTATFADADSLVVDFIDAIGREAEAAGWYGEWASMMGWSEDEG